MGDGPRDELEGLVETLHGLGEIDDVDPVALSKDVGAHLRIPAPRLVTEMDAGFEQLAH